MSLKKRDIKLDSSGADVKQLQFELSLLDLNIPDEEAADNDFAKAHFKPYKNFRSSSVSRLT
ncbi:hypothetical protein [Psychrobacter sp. GP33]|uniref:hypothetical protein n=1 Tax=Psychrobacter sp. GP33 TaxID=2758709 RepID=UPI0015FC2BAE|nr:hypothetical protein [Psychrobacter sp. GP33]